MNSDSFICLFTFKKSSNVSGICNNVFFIHIIKNLFSFIEILTFNCTCKICVICYKIRLIFTVLHLRNQILSFTQVFVFCISFHLNCIDICMRFFNLIYDLLCLIDFPKFDKFVHNSYFLLWVNFLEFLLIWLFDICFMIFRWNIFLWILAKLNFTVFSLLGVVFSNQKLSQNQ